MSQDLNPEPEQKPVYEKPELVCYGSLRETTRTIGQPLPGLDAFPAVDIYGDPS